MRLPSDQHLESYTRPGGYINDWNNGHGVENISLQYTPQQLLLDWSEMCNKTHECAACNSDRAAGVSLGTRR